MKWLRCLWLDCSGAVAASELLLINTILVIGAIAGLATVRDQMVQQFGDLADALQSIDQSFTINCSNVTMGFVDSGFPTPVEGAAPACLSLCGDPVEEQ